MRRRLPSRVIADSDWPSEIKKYQVRHDIEKRGAKISVPIIKQSSEPILELPPFFFRSTYDSRNLRSMSLIYFPSSILLVQT